ncbi:MAG: hypothetical protein EKK57_05290 [Proteobacteria bacterium]|nr:MAG: hypothetical protein EKK57_05290 [Pseudomonadota bacterium]
MIRVTPEITLEMVKFMFLVLLALCAMWFGYSSNCYSILFCLPVFSKLKNNNDNCIFYPRKNVLMILLLISLISKLIQIRLGIFGYLSTINPDNASRYYEYTQLIYYSSQFGAIALLMVSLMYFSEDKSRYANISLWFYFILSEEVFLGFISGFKSAMFVPFLLVIICQYIKTNNIQRKWLLYTLFSVMVAFSIIPSYRDALQKSQQNGDSALDTTTSVLSSQDNGDNLQDVPIIIAVLSRLNLSYLGSQGIKYYDENSYYAGDPNFLNKILLSPVSAWVPRFLWNSKSISNDGVWYTKYVLRNFNSLSSTAMSLIVNLYMAAGFIAVIVGYFFLGVMQRFILILTNPHNSLSGAFVYIAMLSTMSINAEMLMDSVMINFFRLFPLLIVLQKILFKSELR